MIFIDRNESNKLAKDSSADCFQVRSISEKRILTKIGDVDSKTIVKIKEGLAKVLSIEY